MSIIQSEKFIDIYDLPKETQEAFAEIASKMGINNGEYFTWRVGEKDSVAESWTDKETCMIIDKSLREVGLKDGKYIKIKYWW